MEVRCLGSVIPARLPEPAGADRCQTGYRCRCSGLPPADPERRGLTAAVAASGAAGFGTRGGARPGARTRPGRRRGREGSTSRPAHSRGTARSVQQTYGPNFEVVRKFDLALRRSV